MHWYSLSPLWFYSPALCSWPRDFQDVFRIIPFDWGVEKLLTTLLRVDAHGLFALLWDYQSMCTCSLRLHQSFSGFASRQSWYLHRFYLQASVLDLRGLVASLHSQMQVFVKLMLTGPPSYLAYHWKICLPLSVPLFRLRDLLARQSFPISNWMLSSHSQSFSLKALLTQFAPGLNRWSNFKVLEFSFRCLS